MAERTTVRLPEQLVRRAKRRAAEQGRTLTALIEDSVRRVLDERAVPEKKRILPPVSNETGGVVPGIDISNSAALQEMDDLEYVERMQNGFSGR